MRRNCITMTMKKQQSNCKQNAVHPAGKTEVTRTETQINAQMRTAGHNANWSSLVNNVSTSRSERNKTSPEKVCSCRVSAGWTGSRSKVLQLILILRQNSTNPLPPCSDHDLGAFFRSPRWVALTREVQY